MAHSHMTGARIRERRLALGRKQADLARAVGVSPAYLNLIEHNRRRIGGRLVQDLARELDVDVAALTEGAGAELFEALRSAARGHAAEAEPAENVEEFALRHPVWADLLIETAGRAAQLERAVEVLADRIAYDPQLSTSIHEVLSTVTAIRSTASILVETPEIDSDWRHRFHRNLEEEAGRLADGTADLVRYLDAAADAGMGATTASEEVDQWLAQRGYHVAELERAVAPSVESVVQSAQDALTTQAARAAAARYLETYAADAKWMPLRPLREALARDGIDPAALARTFDVPLSAVLRRLATLPPEPGGAVLGLVRCDASGALIFRKPIAGFDLPRHSTACPLWPLYEALTHPHQPLRRPVETGGRVQARFLTFAVCEAVGPTEFDRAPVLEAAMLIVPQDRAPEAPEGPARQIGITCRICARAGCTARRDPSLLPAATTQGF